jgi:hypothetical protein
MTTTTGPQWGQTTEAKAALAELEALATRCATTDAAEAVRRARLVALRTTDADTRLIYGGHSAKTLSQAMRAARRAVGAQ